MLLLLSLFPNYNLNYKSKVSYLSYLSVCMQLNTNLLLLFLCFHCLSQTLNGKHLCFLPHILHLLPFLHKTFFIVYTHYSWLFLNYSPLFPEYHNLSKFPESFLHNSHNPVYRYINQTHIIHVINVVTPWQQYYISKSPKWLSHSSIRLLIWVTS